MHMIYCNNTCVTTFSYDSMWSSCSPTLGYASLSAVLDSLVKTPYLHSMRKVWLPYVYIYPEFLCFQE